VRGDSVTHRGSLTTQGHYVGVPGGIPRQLYAPVDIEGHLGLDGRYYVVVRWRQHYSAEMMLLDSSSLTFPRRVGLCSNVPARATLANQVRSHTCSPTVQRVYTANITHVLYSMKRKGIILFNLLRPELVKSNKVPLSPGT
jgi:hypothetical protein